MLWANRPNSLRWPSLVLAGSAAFFCAAVSMAAETSPAAKFQKTVTAKLQKGKGEWYVLQLTKTTMQANAHRKETTIQRVRGALVQVDSDHFEIAPNPVPEPQFVVVEGTEAAVDAIMQHMAPTFEKRAKGKKVKGVPQDATPPAELTWDYLGRMATQEEAQALADQAKAEFDASPHWRSESDADDAKKKPGAKRKK